jgi:hypothetical protein
LCIPALDPHSRHDTLVLWVVLSYNTINESRGMMTT